MDIYIDNNILIDYEEGKIVLPRTESLKYYYSYVHIQELIESGVRFEQLKERRIQTIVELTGNKYCSNNIYSNVELSSQDPRAVLSTHQENEIPQLLMAMIREISNHWFDGRNPDTIMKYYGIEKSRINNYSPDEIVREYKDFIQSYVLLTSDGTLMAAFQSLFNAMDLLGFWQDKITPRSIMARSYDANHSYFASACDYFVTNDKRTCNKANVLYYFYEMKTRAVSLMEFLETLHIANHC